MWLPSDESLRLLMAQIVLTGEPGNNMLGILSDSEVSNWDLRNAEITTGGQGSCVPVGYTAWWPGGRETLQPPVRRQLRDKALRAYL